MVFGPVDFKTAICFPEFDMADAKWRLNIFSIYLNATFTYSVVISLLFNGKASWMIQNVVVQPEELSNKFDRNI